MKPLWDEDWIYVAMQVEWLAESIRDAVQGDRETNLAMRLWMDDHNARALVIAAQALTAVEEIKPS